MFSHYSTKTWDENSKVIAEKLGLNKTQAFLFPNLDSALIECALGLAINFPHKKKFIYSSAFGSHYYNVISRLVKMDMKSVEFTEPDLEGKLVESLFAIGDVDNPITGELNQNLDKLKGKNIYRILVNHNRHRSQGFPKQVDKRDVELFVLSDKSVIALVGEKYQFTPLVAHTLKNVKTNIAYLDKDLVENKTWVNSVESSGWNGAKAWFTTSAHRLYDRALIYFEDKNGEAMAHEIEKKYNLGPNTVFAVNYCAEEGDYQPKFFNDSRVRGLVIISAAALEKIKKLS